MSYAEFLRAKAQHNTGHGFEPNTLPDHLFPFQRELVEWSVRQGRGGIFADCGLGKTPMELAWAENAHRQTGKLMREMPYRLLGTATAAPNDYLELGTSAEALGELGYMDMLSRFFVNDQRTSTHRPPGGKGRALAAHPASTPPWSRPFETREGERRTVFEVDVDEIGPSLRYATAKVQRTPSGGGQSSGWGQASQPRQSQPQGQDPWASSPAASSDEAPF